MPDLPTFRRWTEARIGSVGRVQQTWLRDGGWDGGWQV